MTDELQNKTRQQVFIRGRGERLNSSGGLPRPPKQIAGFKIVGCFRQQLPGPRSIISVSAISVLIPSQALDRRIQELAGM